LIKKLGRIDIPQNILDDVKNREPDRLVKHVDGKTHAINVKELGEAGWNVDNFKHYDNDRCTIKEYCLDWYKDIVSDNFLHSYNLEKPKNAIVLRVDPGTFSVPHCDRFKHALRDNPDLKLDDIVRLWIPLEDSEFGDAFFVGEKVLHKWRAGQVYTFDNYTIHSAANAGLHTRYTLIVYTNKTKRLTSGSDLQYIVY
jgi:hypothetical protein